MMLKVTELISN